LRPVLALDQITGIGDTMTDGHPLGDESDPCEGAPGEETALPDANATMTVTTARRHRIAVVSDASSDVAAGPGVDIPALLARLHTRAALFDQLAGIHAVPMCVEIRNLDRLVNGLVTVTNGFRGVFLSEIASPRSLILCGRLGRCLDVPVVHEAREPAAIVVLAALCNALAAVGTPTRDAKVVVVGADATQLAIANLLHAHGLAVTLVMSEASARLHLEMQAEFLEGVQLHVGEDKTPLLTGADVLVASELSISLDAALARMAPRPVVFLLDSTAEWMNAAHTRAQQGRIAVLATRTSHLPNRLDWALAYPGTLRGMVDVGAANLTLEMQRAAGLALARAVNVGGDADAILPTVTAAHGSAVADAIRAEALGKSDTARPSRQFDGRARDPMGNARSWRGEMP
jgi:malate dehydrogenase (oxaloacetate-decarboxylating)